MADPTPGSASKADGYELVEIAPSGRVTCKKCHQLIEKGSLRVGNCFTDLKAGYERRNWYHPACWPVPRKLASLDQLVGWEHLIPEQRAPLEARAAQTIAAQSAPAAAQPRRLPQPKPTGKAATGSPSTSRPKAGAGKASADERAEEAWLHNKAAAAGSSTAESKGAASAPLPADSMAAEGPPAGSDLPLPPAGVSAAEHAATVAAWMTRAPPDLEQIQLEFLLGQSVEECAEALPAIEARLSEVLGAMEGAAPEAAGAAADQSLEAVDPTKEAAKEAAHLAFMVEVVRARMTEDSSAAATATDTRASGTAFAAAAAGKAPAGGRAGPAVDNRPICKYGSACYRENPQHKRDFRHDVEPDKDTEQEKKKKKKISPRGGGGGGKRKRRGAGSDESEAEFSESEGEDGAVEIMPSKLRARRRRVDYAGMDEGVEEDTEGEEEGWDGKGRKGRSPAARGGAAGMDEAGDEETEEEGEQPRQGNGQRRQGRAPATPRAVAPAIVDDSATEEDEPSGGRAGGGVTGGGGGQNGDGPTGGGMVGGQTGAGHTGGGMARGGHTGGGGASSSSPPQVEWQVDLGNASFTKFRPFDSEVSKYRPLSRISSPRIFRTFFNAGELPRSAGEHHHHRDACQRSSLTPTGPGPPVSALL
jgi:hypothetical protein